jgi:chemotaxis-related protein WspB
MLLLMFRVAQAWYAVEANRVVEVVPRIDLREVPHATEALAGLFRYRGKVVPVVDLGVLIGGSACRRRLSTRIIVVDAAARGSKPIEAEWLGLIAEQVNDVRKVTEDEVTASPMQLDRAPYLGSIVQSRDQIIQLIEVDRVLTGSLRSDWFGGPSEAS